MIAIFCHLLVAFLLENRIFLLFEHLLATLESGPVEVKRIHGLIKSTKKNKTKKNEADMVSDTLFPQSI